MPLRILHISDLHERSSFDGISETRSDQLQLDVEHRGLVLGPLFYNSLAEIKANGVDLVCFTGDLADWGLPEEYEAATLRLTKILKTLGVPRDRFFAIPGNHDIQRNVHKDAWLGIRSWYSRERTNDNYSALSRWFRYARHAPPPLKAEWRDLVLERSRSFWDWFESFRHEGLRPSRPKPLGYRHTFPAGAINHIAAPVHIIGLDSAWLCGDDHDQGQILVTEDQVLGHTRVREEPLDGIRLALVHHPLDHLGDHHEVRRALANNGADILLHGHQHVPLAITTAEAGNQLRVIAAGCLIEGDFGKSWPNGFQLIEIDPYSEKVTVHFRKWSRDGRFWAIGSDIYREAPNGVLVLPAHPMAQPSRPLGASTSTSVSSADEPITGMGTAEAGAGIREVPNKPQSPTFNTIVRDLLSNFANEKNNKLYGFTGRQWVLEEVHNWLTHANVSRTMLIEAGPGFGKSALAARIINEFQGADRIVVYHFCMAKAQTTLDPERLCLSLRAQLAISKVLEPLQRQHETLTPAILFEDLVAGPLSAQAKSGQAQQILIVIDSLDEAAEFGSRPGVSQTILDVAGIGNATLPQNVRLLFTARPDHSDRFAGTVGGRKLKIDEAKFSNNNRDDVTQFTKLRWEKSEAVRAAVERSGRFGDENEFAAKLAAASKGNFLYARLLLDDIEKNGNVLKAFDQLPEGLEQLYCTFLEQRHLGRKWRGVNAEFAGTLAAGRAPFDRDQLWAYSNEGDRGLTRQEANEFLEDAGQFIDIEEVSPRKRYRFHHLSFSEFLFNVESRFWIDPEGPHGRIGRKASQSYWNQGSYNSMDEYAKSWVLYHLQRGKQWDAFINLLSEVQFLDGQLAENRRDKVLEEVFEAYKAMEADSNASNFSDRLLTALVIHIKRREAALADHEFRGLINDYYRGARPNIYRQILLKYFDTSK
jgi:calcineurin-like phosphoesterase family protein